MDQRDHPLQLQSIPPQGTALAKQLPDPQRHHQDLQKGEEAQGHFKTHFYLPSTTTQGNIPTTLKSMLSKPFREAQTPGFAHLLATNGQPGAQQWKRGEMGQMQHDSWLHQLQSEPKAPGAQPHLLQLGPSRSQLVF